MLLLRAQPNIRPQYMAPTTAKSLATLSTGLGHQPWMPSVLPPVDSQYLSPRQGGHSIAMGFEFT